MGVYIKNIDSVSHIFRGHTVNVGAYFQIPEIERMEWHSDSTILQHITDDQAKIAKDDSGANDIDDKAAQWDYLGNLVANGVEVTNTQIKVFDEFTSAEKIPKFACQSASFVGTECVLEIKCPGTLGETGRYLKDGYAFTNAYYFGDRVSKLEVVDVDNILGFGAGVVLKTYHDEGVAEANQGWLLWAGEQSTGEVDLENAGGWGIFPAGLYLRCTFKKDALSTATKGAINIFWADDES